MTTFADKRILRNGRTSAEPRRYLQVAKRAIGLIQHLVARSRWASRFYLSAASAMSRHLAGERLGRHVEARVFRSGTCWPALPFPARSAILGKSTNVRLIPHIGEFDQSALFRKRLDYESEVFSWLESAAASRYDAVIEIGANVGVYSIFFDALIKASGGCRLQKIVAFEPSLEAYSRLLANLGANSAQHVIPIRAAVASVPGFVEFFEPEGHLTNGSLVRDFANLFSNRLKCDVVFGHGPEEIEYFLKRYAKVLIKIDVEGYEPELLRSLGQITLEHRPDFIVEVLAQTVERLNGIRWLKDYDLFLIGKDGPAKNPEFFASEEYRDWLLSPKLNP